MMTWWVAGFSSSWPKMLTSHRGLSIERWSALNLLKVIKIRLTSDIRNVVPALLLANLLNLADIVLRQVDLLEVLGNTLRCNRLGDDTVATNLSPGEPVGQTLC
jgi:hypothetical protein